MARILTMVEQCTPQFITVTTRVRNRFTNSNLSTS